MVNLSLQKSLCCGCCRSSHFLRNLPTCLVSRLVEFQFSFGKIFPTSDDYHFFEFAAFVILDFEVTHIVFSLSFP